MRIVIISSLLSILSMGCKPATCKDLGDCLGNQKVTKKMTEEECKSDLEAMEAVEGCQDSEE
jgi:hypothetical protein